MSTTTIPTTQTSTIAAIADSVKESQRESADATLPTTRNSSTSTIISESESKTNEIDDNAESHKENESENKENEDERHVNFGTVEYKLCLNLKDTLTRDQRGLYWYTKGDMGVFQDRYQRDIEHEKEKLAAKKRKEKQKEDIKESMAAFARSFHIGGHDDDHSHDSEKINFGESMAALARSFGHKNDKPKRSTSPKRSKSPMPSPMRTLFGLNKKEKSSENECIYSPEVCSKKALMELKMFLRDHEGNITEKDLQNQRFMKVQLTQADMRTARVLLANHFGGNATNNERMEAERKAAPAPSPAPGEKPVPYYFGKL